MRVEADQLFGYAGYSASVAVGILESNSTLLVSESANIVTQGDLVVGAYTSDFTYVGAISDAENNGKLAASGGAYRRQ
ncbi:hypothetical protein [Vibrio taketomensis]|uniref:hypothetical protein n=1 Tax=Vibrio taketomensis TaxID=2572923 RepID=UPI001389B970|nr:hypothetical protein [Vibrio taketomensis]